MVEAADYGIAVSSVASINEGTASAEVVTVTLNQAVQAGDTVLVDWRLAAGSAVSPADYTNNSGTLSFSVGEIEKKIYLTSIADSLVEGDETVDIVLENPRYGMGSGTISGGTVTETVTIVNTDAAVLTVESKSVSESVGTASFIVTSDLVIAPGATVTFDYGTSNGTATSGSDYTATTGSGSITNGTTTTISVPILPDVIVEADEAFTLSLSNPSSNATVGGSGTETIKNDDAAVLTVESKSVSESVGTASFTVTSDLVIAPGATVTFDYGTSNGTATSGSDYTATTGSGSITNGTTTTISVPILPDAVVEADETFTLSLSNPSSNATVGGSGTETITNDDAAVLTVESKSVSESVGTASFIVTSDLVIAPGATVTFDYGTSNGTATSGSDYTATTGSGSITNGTTTTISVPILPDVIVEADEAFTLSLSNPSSNATVGGSGTETITNDDAAVLTVESKSVSESVGTASFTVTSDLVIAPGATVTFDYGTSNGTATSGSDYTATTGSGSITNGTTTTISVPILPDVIVEADEAFTLSLSNPSSNATVGGSGTETITNDDAAVLTVESKSVSESVGTASFTVTSDLVIAPGATVTFDYGTSNGTATSGSDYTATTGSGSITNGTTTTISVPILPDVIVEADEAFTLSLSNPSSNATVGGGGTETITNDDAAVLTVESKSVSESVGTASFTVTSDLVIAPGATVTFDYGTSNGTATSGSDYTATTGSGSITNGTTTTISVPILPDVIVEADEAFTLSLSNPSSNATVGGSGTETILNDDYEITLTSGAQGSVSTTFGLGATAPPNASVIVTQGDQPVFTIASTDTCYHIGGVQVNGVDIPGAVGTTTYPYTFAPVTENKTINADFAINQYTITATVLGGHGTLSPTQTVSCNTSGQVYTATADAGYTITWLKVNGTDVTVPVNSTTISYTFSSAITANQTVEVAFSQQITVLEESVFGTINPVGDVNNLLGVPYGSNQIFVATATDPCPNGLTHNGKKHHISDLIVDGVVVAGAAGQDTYPHTFTNITENHTIEALFTSYVDLTVGANGHVETSSGNVNAGTSDSKEVKAHGSLAVKAVPAAGFYISDVKVNGVSVGHPETYSFEDIIDKDSTYEVTFGINNFILEPVSRFNTIFKEATFLTKATAQTVAYGTSGSFFVRLNDAAHAVYGILVDNVTYPIPASGATVPYASFTLINNAATSMEVRFTNIVANHRLEVQDYDTSPISDVPLDAKLRPKPASLMFVLDDSGSMDWEVITPASTGDGLFRGDYYVYSYPNVSRARVYTDNSLEAHNEQQYWKSQWAGMNKMFYNPEVVYVPWPTFTGTPSSQLPAVAADGLAHANTYRPRLHPWYSQDCTDALNLAKGLAGDLSNCNNATDNNHNFPMDDVFLQFEEITKRIIVDNTDTAFARSGDWNVATPTGRYGTNALVRAAGATTPDTATWTFTPVETKQHEVFAWWAAATSRSTAVPYTVSCTNCGSSGTTMNVNQQNNGGQWNKLGEFNFVAGETVTVRLVSPGTNANLSCADAVRINPKDANISIINAHYYTWSDTNGNGIIDFTDANGNKQIDEGETVLEDIYLVNLTNPIEYFKVINNTLVVSGTNLLRVPAASLPATVKTFVPPADPDAWTKERQNWADWFSYYRKRTLAATGAVAQVIDRMEEVEIGIRTINYNSGGYEAGGYGISQAVLPVNVAGVADQTNRLLQLLYGFQVQAYGTPLQLGLQAVGRYYDDTDASNGGIGTSPYHAREDGDECKQVFTIVMTDGYWNGGSPGVGNVDSGKGIPYADTYSNTLADVASYYFDTDLSTMDDLVPDGIYNNQHMVTYTVAFGVIGSLNPADYDFNKGIYPTWPNPTTNDLHKVDDLWHTAVNGRGKFMSASRPDQLVDSLLDIMNDIGTRVGSGSSVSVNGDEMYESVSGQTRMFQTTYNSGNWHGDLKAYRIDTTTGDVVSSAPVWSAEAKMATRLTTTGSGHVSRIIASYNGTTGIPFRWSNLTPLQQQQVAPYFIASTTSGMTGEHVVNYLRGDKTNETTGTLGEFRVRDAAHPLGDFIHSLARFQDDVLYVGGNDGMLHAFQATDTGGGEELFAYVPNLVYRDLRELADPVYSHKFYVDNTPDTHKMGATTMLVGGLGKGGKGYYCLDITNAKTAITSEGDLASRVKWEYPAPPATLLSGTTFSFSSGTGTGGDDRISDSLKRFTAANQFVVGRTIAVVGANFNNGLISGTNDKLYKIKRVDAAGAFIEVEAGSLVTGYGNGKNILITKSTSDTGMGYSYSKAFFVETNDLSIGTGDLKGWVVIFGNGYGSEDGTASFYILNPADGTVLKKIDTHVGPFNGLSTPNAIDVNNDLRTDYVYAGDLLGNMWKFDLTSTDHTKWQVAYCDNANATNHCQDTVAGMIPKPLFAGLANQPITAAPDIMRHQSKVGYMVIFGTGKYLGEPDLASMDVQSLYGIWDWAPDALDDGYQGVRVDVGSVTPKTATLSNWPEVDIYGTTVHTLLRQVAWVEGVLTEDTDKDSILDAGEDIDGDGVLDTYSYYRIPSNYPGDWSTQKTTELESGHRYFNKDINKDGVVNSKDVVPKGNVGWVFDLPGKIDFLKDKQDNDKDGVVDETGERILGERVVNDTIIRDGRAILISFGVTGSRCNAGAYSFLNERNAQTGGMLYSPAFDLNGDGKVNADDYVNIQAPYDANNDGVIDSNDVIAGIPGDIAYDGRLYNPAILGQDSLGNNGQEKKYFSTSQGSIIVVDEKAEKRGMSFWQQIE
ncbi:PilC/PilY family type IV pilus protein [uncultured Desulfobulbus sp.]|uniref:PilC/PilY family type IV pilus protein n=1 Tax=uncultured Desulfobulbus sp. TaxID=239745 RepID=UPI0029C72489|nr:PilC/PilY family type IV pilus protein [uncultured Desulfobulbus sp.]